MPERVRRYRDDYLKWENNKVKIESIIRVSARVAEAELLRNEYFLVLSQESLVMRAIHFSPS